MSILAMIAAASTLAGGALQFECELMVPEKDNFMLVGSFDGAVVHSNLRELVEYEVDLVPTEASGICIVSGQYSCMHSWDSGEEYGRVVAVSMVEDVERSHASIRVTESNFIGRHRTARLVGIGLCKTSRQTSEAAQ